MNNRLSAIDKIDALANVKSASKAVDSLIGYNYGGYIPSGDLGRDEYGAAAAYAVIVEIFAAIAVWETYLDGITWIVKDKATGKEIGRTDIRDYPLAERGGKWIASIRRFEQNYHHSLWKSLAFSDWLYGNSYLAMLPADKQLHPNKQLWAGIKWLNPLNVSSQEYNGRIQYYSYMGMDDDVAMHIPLEQMAYRINRRNAFDDNLGYSGVLAAMDAINLSRNAVRAFKNFFSNGMQLGGVISPTGENTWSDRELENARREWANNHKGAANAGRWAVLPKRAEITPFGQEDASSNFSVTKDLRNTIYAAMSVFPQLAGDPSDATYDNAKDIKRQWWEMLANPYAKDIAGYHTNVVIPKLEPDANVYIEPDLSPYETEEPDIISQDVNAGIIDISKAQQKRGYAVDNDLRDIYMVNGRPMSKSVIIQLANTMPASEAQGFAQADKYEAETAQIESAPTPSVVQLPDGGTIEDAVGNEQAIEAALNAEIMRGSSKAEFASYTLNGVTCQATGRRSSSRDDKKYERTVRYNGDERTVHYGDPNMEMQRDNDEARDNFLSRHDCDSKKDPFAAGFWACYDWKNTDEKSAKPLDCDCDEHEHSHDLPSLVDYSDIAELDELAAWRKFINNGKAHKRPFEQKALRGDIGDSIQAAIESKDKQIILDAFKNAQERIETRIKAIQATRLDFENDFTELLERARAERMGRVQWSSAMRSIIRRYGNRAYLDGMADGGIEDEPSEDDKIEINRLIGESSKYVTELGNVLYRGDGITDAVADTKAAMWYNKTVAGFYQAGLISADANGLYEWRYGSTEHCSDCLRLNGQRHRLKGWKANYMPQSSLLECQGYNCACQLIKVRGRARGKY